MIQYILHILAYILPDFLIKDIFISYAVRISLTVFFLIIFWKRYKLKFKFSIYSILAGILIFLSWIFITVSFKMTEFNPKGYFLILKIIGFIIITPLVEELFTRDFLIRMSIALEKKQDFEKIKIGSFTIISSVVSVLFFGFSHYMWLAGIISAILLNLLLYKTKRVSDCILAHSLANLMLSIYILQTNTFFLW